MREPFYFHTIIPILWGMHILMKFIHAIGAIMAGSGLKEILAGIFWIVDKMLTGKKYPQKFRALRMLVEELLIDLVKLPEVASFTYLVNVLENRANRSRTTKMRTVNLIIMMKISRACHENDCALHRLATEAMLPYFCAAGFHNYARYCTFNIHQMKSLDPQILR